MSRNEQSADDGVRDRLLATKPRSVDASVWAQLRGPAVGLVVATGAGHRSAQALLSRLLVFAAAYPGVAQAQGLPALLADERIDAWAPAGVPRASLIRARTDLRRLARAAGTRPERVVLRRDPPNRSAAAWWPPMAGAGPFTALAQAYQQGTGRRVHGGMWDHLDGLAPQWWSLAVLVPSAGVAAAGTLRAVRAAGRTMRSAPTQTARQVSPADTTRTSPGSSAGSASSRRVSRTAAARAARAARAAARQQEPAAPVLAELPELAPDLMAAIAGYAPHGLADAWPQIGAATRAALTAYCPPSTRWLSSAGGHVARYAAWVNARPAREVAGPLTAVELVAAGLVDEYLATALAGTPDASRATIRSVLRRVVGGLTGAERTVLGYTPVQAPYSPAECAAFVRLARNQPKDAGRRAMLAMVGLGLGAGLDGREQKAVTPAHCRDVDLGDGVTGLAVRVEGKRARTVIVRAEYEPLVREALRLHARARRGQGTPLHGVDKDRRNITSTVTRQAVTATGTGVNISAARLRSTWLVALMCAPVPLAALLHAAGLTGARTLVDLLPHCPEPDPADVARILRAAGTETDPGEAGS